MVFLPVAAFLGAAVLLPTGATLLVLGLRGPRLPETPTATGGPVPHLIRRLVPVDHRSTYTERQECRLRLGPSYDTQLVAVADNLARRPAALRGIAMETTDLPIDDLVTVSTYLHGRPTGLDRALRNGTSESHRSVIACLISGLRRFPFHQGACYGLARAVGVPLDVYGPGRTIVEPAFIRTDTQWLPGSVPADDTEIVFAFWSRTGRQVGALGAGSRTVIFAAGTSFRVLGVTPGGTGSGPGVVFLDERPERPGPWNAVLDRLGIGPRWILGQLRREISAAAGTPDDPPLRTLPELGFTPGFDETGRPYREESHQR